MQKRKSVPSVLPMTENDAAKSLRNGRTLRKKKVNISDVWSVCRLFAGILGLGLVVVFVQRSAMVRGKDGLQHSPLFEYVPQDDEATQDRPLSNFPSLQFPLRNSRLVGIYFAASWCPMSTPVTELLDEHFQDVLLPPPFDESIDLPQRHGFSIVYVSSDSNEAEMKEYKRENWFSIPFNSDERGDVKKHFLTCAKREIEELGFQRKHEIPTLIIVEAESQQVLTFHGVQDVREYGRQAIDHWMELAGLSNALDSKYAR